MTGRLTWVSVRAICCPQPQLTGLKPLCVCVCVCSEQWWPYILNTAVTDQSAEFPLHQLLPTTSRPGPPDWDETTWPRAENSFIQLDGFRAAEKKKKTDQLTSIRGRHIRLQNNQITWGTLFTLGSCVSVLWKHLCVREQSEAAGFGEYHSKRKIQLLMGILNYDYREIRVHATSDILESVTGICFFKLISSVKFEEVPDFPCQDVHTHGTDLSLNAV